MNTPTPCYTFAEHFIENTDLYLTHEECLKYNYSWVQND
jgi:hypothetical protein